MERCYTPEPLCDVKDVLLAFKKHSNLTYKIKNPDYDCFKKIFKHYMMCVLSPSYINTIDENENNIKQMVKAFNVARCNFVTEIVQKAKFENMKLFNILSWVYSAKKIIMVKAHKADTHYCYVTSEKIEEAYIPILHIYTAESKSPRVVAVASQYNFFIYHFI